MSASLDAHYRYLIRRAVRDNDPEQAQKLREWAYERYGLDLLEYCLHPSTHTKVA